LRLLVIYKCGVRNWFYRPLKGYCIWKACACNRLTEDFEKLKKAKTIKKIMGVEGGAAYKYWNKVNKAIPEEYDFCARIAQYKNAAGAGNKTNVLINYGQALLKADVKEPKNKNFYKHQAFII
jgi:CRISPR/Cas system-associated endonuclease Cas1